MDDDASIRLVVNDVLSDEGYAVAEAGNGAEALDWLTRATTPPGVILLDMRMPVLDGWGFTAAYRRQPEPHAPIIVMTAAQHAHEWCRQVQADGCVPKPFELPALLGDVARLAGPPGE